MNLLGLLCTTGSLEWYIKYFHDVQLKYFHRQPGGRIWQSNISMAWKKQIPTFPAVATSKWIHRYVHRISPNDFHKQFKLDSLIQKNKRTLSTCWCTMFHATTVWTHSHHPLPVDLWTSLSIGQLRNNLSWSDVFNFQRLELTPKRSCTFSQPKTTVVGGDSSPVWHIYCSKKIGSFHPGVRVKIKNIEKSTTQKMVSEAYPWRNVSFFNACSSLSTDCYPKNTFKAPPFRR